jgi:hypothetical protein
MLLCLPNTAKHRLRRLSRPLTDLIVLSISSNTEGAVMDPPKLRPKLRCVRLISPSIIRAVARPSKQQH